MGRRRLLSSAASGALIVLGLSSCSALGLRPSLKEATLASYVQGTWKVDMSWQGNTVTGTVTIGDGTWQFSPTSGGADALNGSWSLAGSGLTISLADDDDQAVVDGVPATVQAGTFTQAFTYSFGGNTPITGSAARDKSGKVTFTFDNERPPGASTITVSPAKS